MICKIYNYHPNYSYEKIILTNINFPQFVFGKHIFANICSNFFWTIFTILFTKFICAQNICFQNFVSQNCIFYKVSRRNQFTNLYFAKFLEVYYQRIFFCKSLTSFENNFVKKIWKTFDWKKAHKIWIQLHNFFCTI